MNPISLNLIFPEIVFFSKLIILITYTVKVFEDKRAKNRHTHKTQKCKAKDKGIRIAGTQRLAICMRKEY